MRHPFTQVENEFTTFFTGLGYTVDWEQSRRSGDEWYEIIDDEGLICQIDMGVPLAHVIEDLACFARGVPGTSASDYSINAPDDPRFDALLAKVAAVATQPTLP